MSAAGPLPDGFAALEPFAAFWAADTLSGRDTCRLESSEEQRLAFYGAAGELAGRAWDYLDGKPLADYRPEDRRLLHLMLSLVHVALAVEVQRDGEAEHARGARRMPITRCHSDPA